MATMTLQQFQDQVQILFLGNTDTPSSTDDSWDLRLGLGNAAINQWEAEENSNWDELWVKLTNAADGTKTTTGSSAVLTCPTNFSGRTAGWLYLTNSSDQKTWYKFLKPEEVQQELIVNSSNKYYYITGNPQDGFQITLSDTPTSGQTIEYAYYKNADTLSVAADEFEMSDPYFAVHYTLSMLHMNAGNSDKANLHLSMAQAKMKAMKFKNSGSPSFQSQTVRDYQFGGGYQGFGQ